MPFGLACWSSIPSSKLNYIIRQVATSGGQLWTSENQYYESCKEFFLVIAIFCCASTVSSGICIVVSLLRSAAAESHLRRRDRVVSGAPLHSNCAVIHRLFPHWSATSSDTSASDYICPWNKLELCCYTFV